VIRVLLCTVLVNNLQKSFNSHYINYINKVHDDLDEVKQFIKDTIAHIVEKGNSFYVIKNEANGEIEYGFVKKFKGIEFAYRNEKGKLKKKKLEHLLEVLEHEISFDRIDFIASLKQDTDPKVFNLFAGFRHQYRDDFIVDETKINKILGHKLKSHHAKTAWVPFSWCSSLMYSKWVILLVTLS